jgi:hypothetical protein
MFVKLKSLLIRFKEPLCVIALLIFYYFICTINIDIPGYYQDELLHAVLSQKMLSPTQYVSQTHSLASISIFSGWIPLMVLHYVGALKSYLLLPLFWSFGSSLLVLRIGTILFGMGNLLLGYLFIRRYFGIKIAFSVLVLLLSDPSWVLSTTYDWGPVSVQSLLKILIIFLVFFIRQRCENCRLRYFAYLGFLCALLVWDKIIGVWILFPTVLLLRDKISMKTVFCFIIGFFIGILPIIVFAFQFPLMQLISQKFIANNPTVNSVIVTNPAWAFHNNYFQGMFTKINSIYSALDGVGIANTILDSRIAGSGFSLIFILIILLSVLKFKSTIVSTLYIREILVFFIALILCLFLTPFAWQPHHVLFLWPLPHLLFVLFLNKFSRTTQFALIGLVIFLNFCVLFRFHSHLQQGQLSLYWRRNEQEAITKKLQASDKKIVALSWGIALPSGFISNGKLPISDLEGIYKRPCDIIAPYSDTRDTVFVLYTKDISSFNSLYGNCKNTVRLSNFKRLDLKNYSIFNY